jgi:hypothetical protein
MDRCAIRLNSWFLLLVTAGALALTTTGCGSSSAPSAVTQTTTVKRIVRRTIVIVRPPRRVVKHHVVIVHPATLSYTRFSGSYFSIDYPETWTQETDETDKGAYLDTTIRSDQSDDVMLRVDVTPNSSADAIASADQLRQTLSRQHGYRQLRYVRTTFRGYSAVAWEFVVDEHGAAIRKVDVLFDDDYGDGFAVLTQAPLDAYSQWQAILAHIEESLVVTP